MKLEQITERALEIFNESMIQYHVSDDVDTPITNPYPEQSIEHILYLKNWIDTVQWHLEDIIRNPTIDPVTALQIKRRIDRSNQDRTDLVERIDSYFGKQLIDVPTIEDATINTETPAWAFDRLSILTLKIAHMREETLRGCVSEDHIKSCSAKLNILIEQRQDLTTAISQLLEDLCKGTKKMKLYKQMKMYNDPNLNPVLYGDKK